MNQDRSSVPTPPWIAAQQQTLLAQRGHAWLLQGPSGLGQFDLALGLVRAWLCEAPTLPATRGSLPPEGALAALGRPGGGADEAPTLPAARGSLPPEGALAALGRPGGGSGEAPTLPATRGSLPPEGALAALGRPGGGSGETPTPQGACGQCPSCHAIDVHTHPDLVVLLPEAEMIERGWPLPEKAQAEIDDKKRKPSKEIRVEAMRDAIEFAQRTSGRGRGKAVLVYPAERMNPISANALLKTLEEPPGDMRFVLASNAAHLLLPTIRSRCLGHTMTWPAEADALLWLAATGIPSADAAALLRAAGGRPAEALALAAAKDSARQWSLLPRAMAAGDVSALANLPLPEAVARLQKLCHDLMAVQAGAAPRFFDPADLPQRCLSASALTRWWTQLGQAARTAEHPLNPGLATEFLVSTACQALKPLNYGHKP